MTTRRSKKERRITVDLQVKGNLSRRQQDALLSVVAERVQKCRGRSEGGQSGGGCGGCEGPEYFYSFPSLQDAEAFLKYTQTESRICFVTFAKDKNMCRVKDTWGTCHSDIAWCRSSSARSGGDDGHGRTAGGKKGKRKKEPFSLQKQQEAMDQIFKQMAAESGRTREQVIRSIVDEQDRERCGHRRGGRFARRENKKGGTAPPSTEVVSQNPPPLLRDVPQRNAEARLRLRPVPLPERPRDFPNSPFSYPMIPASSSSPVGIIGQQPIVPPRPPSYNITSWVRGAPPAPPPTITVPTAVAPPQPDVMTLREQQLLQANSVMRQSNDALRTQLNDCFQDSKKQIELERWRFGTETFRIWVQYARERAAKYYNNRLAACKPRASANSALLFRDTRTFPILDILDYAQERLRPLWVDTLGATTKSGKKETAADKPDAVLFEEEVKAVLDAAAQSKARQDQFVREALPPADPNSKENPFGFGSFKDPGSDKPRRLDSPVALVDALRIFTGLYRLDDINKLDDLFDQLLYNPRNIQARKEQCAALKSSWTGRCPSPCSTTGWRAPCDYRSPDERNTRDEPGSFARCSVPPVPFL